jgi:hypothetical protein
MLRIDYCIVTTNRANALGKLVPEFVQHGYESEGSSLDEFDDFDDSRTSALKINGETNLSVPHKPSGSGGRTIQMGGE